MVGSSYPYSYELGFLLGFCTIKKHQGKHINIKEKKNIYIYTRGIGVWRRFQICLFKALWPTEWTNRVRGLSHCLTWRIDYFDISLLTFFPPSAGVCNPYCSLGWHQVLCFLILLNSFLSSSPISLVSTVLSVFFPHPLVTSKRETWQLVVWFAILMMKVLDQSQSTIRHIYNTF